MSEEDGNCSPIEYHHSTHMSGFVEKCRSEEMGRRPHGLIEWGCLLGGRPDSHLLVAPKKGLAAD
jgi:hypothetical protein